MKSAIYTELSEATGITLKRGTDFADFAIDLIKGVANLKDPAWDALTSEAQDWYNAAADAKNKKKEIPSFPDLEKEEEKEEPRRSNRRKPDDEGDEQPMLKVGDEVTIKTKRGTERKGEIVERTDTVLVIKDEAGDEWEYKIENLESITAKHGAAAEEDDKPRSRRRSEEAAEPAVPELKKGDRAMLVTKRGKEIAGKIVDIDDKGFLLKGDDGEEYDYEFDAIKSLLPEKGAKADEPEGRRSSRGGAAKEKEEAAAPEKGKRANNGDVSIGQRIRELIAEDLDMSLEALTKQLNKEKLEFKDNTVSLNYKEAHKFLEILRAAKRLK